MLGYKPDWDLARRRLTEWWGRRGPAVSITAPRHGDSPPPKEPTSCEQAWLDPGYRLASAIHRMEGTHYAGESFPYFDAQIGPGSLGLFLGCEPRFARDTVWYEPSIGDPESSPPLVLDPGNPWLGAHLALVRAGLRESNGRFLVGVPDLIENFDTLAQLRGPEPALMDLLERPDWVLAKIDEIDAAYFEAFDCFHQLVADDLGGNAFSAFDVWGPGKTAKVQCDAAAMLSPEQFRRFVVPALSEQCRWLDYSLFHLDGTHCIRHLDALLEIESLDAVEWTPQAGIEGGGDPRWYDLYRRIVAGGKCVQAIGVRAEEVLPLYDAVGTEGVMVLARASTPEEAESIAARVHG